MAAARARAEAGPPSLLSGIIPSDRKIHAVLRLSKYSAFATNVTRRRTTSGRNTLSMNDW